MFNSRFASSIIRFTVCKLEKHAPDAHEKQSKSYDLAYADTHTLARTSDDTYAIKSQGGRAYQHIKLTTDVIDQKANCSSIIVPEEKKIAK